MTAGLHELFEAQAGRTPSAPALTWGRDTLTYRELNERANRLAHHLRRLGVGPEDFVGVCLRRSPELVTALLAVLKAGGAYVPLDPAYPRERLGFLLRDTRARVLLTEKRLARELPDSEALAVLVDGEEGFAHESAEDPAAETFADSLAYVIPTSGSTGTPKGVAIRHGGALARVRWAREVFSAEDLAGVLASTSICFDLSVFEIFVPLSWGGRVILAENALELPRLPAAAEVTLVNTVPTAMAELVRTDALPLSVRVVNLAGEALKAGLVQRIYERPSVQRVLNLYGPSEDTTYSTFVALDRQSARSPSIGHPLAGTRACLLDSSLQPVQAGGEGELWLGGDGLARGYLNRPDLTAERFVPDPFGGVPGKRLYRTGDLARWREDGELDFLGRIDHQVKIRGFRIELGEVETALSRIEGVGECVVVAREDLAGSDGKRLVAYLVAARQPGPRPGELRARLQEKLPEHMVPSAFVLLESLPLTPNGKVDRRALPAPGAELLDREPWIAPATPAEDLLAAIWSQVLGVDRVGARDHFFSLGGDSISAYQVVFKVRQSLQAELEIRDVFSYPTLQELARRSEALRQGLVSTPAPRREERGEHPPLSYSQHGLWVYDRLRGRSPEYHVPAVLRLAGDLDAAALERALNEIVRRHESLRTRFPMAADGPAQTVEPFAPSALPSVDLGALPADLRPAEAERLVAEEVRRPFSLEAGPLLRRALLRLGPAEHVLLLTVHHTVIDGWSLEILMRELASFYAGEPAPPEPPLQFVDYAIWQRRWLAGEVLERLAAYWRGRLTPLPQALDLPADRPRPPVQSSRGAVLRRNLPADTAAGLRSRAREQGATFFMTLLAGFDALLARHTGQDDIVVGSPVHSRNHADLENLIGYFVDTLVLRADVSGNPRFAELLDRLREALQRDYAHQDLPFETLVEAVRARRDLSRSPLFQVMLVLNPPLPKVDLQGLRAEWVLPATGAAKFDLSVELTEIDGEMVGIWEYNRDLFDLPTIDRMASHLGALLARAACVTELRLFDLPLLSAEEAQQLLEWNRTEWDYPRELCVHELFEARADLAPRQVAVACAGEELAYAELDERANQLARHLRSLGVIAETRVGIFLERSPDMVVALLAVLKSGGAYVPLDPSNPIERLRLMAEDADIQVLLTQETLAAAWAGFAGRLVRLDADRETIARHERARPAPAADPECLAYAIFTSGSTGRPKCVGIPHRALMNFLDSMAREPGMAAGDTLLALTTLSFDIAALEIFLPLAAGARLVLAPRGTAGNGERLAALLAESGATVVQATPVTWRLLMEHGCRLEGRKLLCGGEALSRRLADRLLESGAELWNLYGPTETTVWSAVSRVTPGEGPVGLGRPIANTGLHLLDRWMVPVPAGAPGELYIGGDGVARGYLGRPALTAERFVPDPFCARPGGRLYRTGDQVRRRGEALEFIGRIDHQVKVRGFRIELGEIDVALTRHPGISAAVVMARQDEEDDRRLVAYVVADPAYQETSAPADLAPGESMRSSFTGSPIPEDELREWTASLADSIRALAPQNVLKIDGPGELRRLEGIADGSLDAVVLDLDAHRFPDVDSLVRVLERAVNAVHAGGFLFIGGVRSLTLQRVFHTAVQLFRADDDLPAEQLRRQVEQQILQETELLLAPGLFFALQRRLPEIRRVEIRPRRGRARNELTCFRYDAVLHLGSEPEEVSWLDWEEAGLDLPELRRRLEVERPACLALRRIPNARVAAAVEAVLRLDGGFSGPAGELRQAAGSASASAVDPEDLLALADELDWHAELSWADPGEDGSFEAFLRPCGEKGNLRLVSPPRPETDPDLPWTRYANNPALGRFSRRLASDLREFLSGSLPEFMIPGSFMQLGALPLTASGKVNRLALPAPDRERPSLGAPFLAPRNKIEEELAKIWSAVLGIEPIGVRDNFFDLGGQSLLAIHVMTQIRSRLGCDLPLLAMLRAPTVEQMAALLKENMPSEYSPLVCLQPAGSKRSFFCVHPAGGQVVRYVPLARLMGGERPFHALQARGLTTDEEPFRSVEEMADHYLAAIRSVQPAGPYLLGGYSLGGLVAYEIASRLEKAGERVAFLALIDMGADEGAAMDDWDDLQVLGFWARLFSIPLSEEEMRSLPPDRRLAHAVELAKSMRKLPPGFTVADALRYVRVHQATLRATHVFKPPPYGGRLTLFKGEDDGGPEHTLGWHRLAAGGVEVIPVTGSHLTMLSMPHLETLAARLASSLERADLEAAG